MSKIRFTQSEYNRIKQINGKRYTVITRPTKEGKIKISAVWVNNGKLVANWATKEVTYMYQVNETILKLNNDVNNKRELIRYEDSKKYSKKR